MGVLDRKREENGSEVIEKEEWRVVRGGRGSVALG